jgi:hypothetical protein
MHLGGPFWRVCRQAARCNRHRAAACHGTRSCACRLHARAAGALLE